MPPLLKVIFNLILPGRKFRVLEEKPLAPRPQYGKLEIDEWPQEIGDNDLHEDLSLDPTFVTRWKVTNFFQRTLAHVVGQATSESKRIRCTEDGSLKVADMGGGIERNETSSGAAPDAYGGPIVFANIATKITVFIWNNDAIFKRSFDGVLWDDEFVIPANSVFEVDVTTLQFDIKNAAVGFVANYQVIGWR